MSRSPTLWFLPLWLILLVPSIDIAVSRIFFDEQMQFRWARTGVLELIRTVGPEVIIGTLVVCVLLYVASLISQSWMWRVAPMQVFYLGLTLLIGPGLIVETLLKPNWGRARPRDISDFGGSATYSPAWQMSDQCDGNCSFVSGHAAVAFWLTAYAFILPAKWRIPVLIVSVILGFAMGVVRIAQGAHFLSDVATAGLVVIAVNEILARLIFNQAQQ